MVVLISFLILLITCVSDTVRAAEPRTASSMKQLRLARQCLPYRVTNMTDQWLKYVRTLEHRARMEAVILEHLEMRLSSGEPMCMAIRNTLQRLINYNRHVMQQRDAEGLPMPEGSGWDETQRLLQSAWPNVLAQCQQRLMTMSPDKLSPRAISDCMAPHKFQAFKAMVLDNLGE